MPVLHEFLEILVELKVYHWSTLSYARHKASDQCFTDLQGLIDKYMEVLLGIVPRTKVFHKQPALRIDLHRATSDTHMMSRIRQLIRTLQKKKLPQDLANLRDEMLTVLHTCLYLFSLK
jgi:hypothetical protein